MSVRPMQFYANGSVDVYHDEMRHGGNVLPAAIRWATLQNGQPDRRWLYLPCPVAGCDSESMHPVSGGAEPEMVQRLFTRRLQALAAGRSWVQARALARVLIQQQDGLERFRLANVNTEDE